jgi:mono/diheme cytochrome c family protein
VSTGENMKGIILQLLAIAMILSLTSCNEAEEATVLEFGENLGSSAQSVDAFKSTVYPILKRNCTECHGDGGGKIGFAVNDASKAHENVVQSGKVNLSSPVNSRLVQRLISDKHNCWGDCDSNGEEMKAAIEIWAKLSNNRSVASVAKLTHPLKISDAITRVPQTEYGTIILQAEDGDISGRFEKFVHQTASGGLQIKGEFPIAHPYGGTLRTARITDKGSAKELTQTDLNNNTYFRITEARRHIGQDGYSYYNVDLGLRIIHPSKRSDFNTERKSGSRAYAELGNDNGNFFLPQSLNDNNYINAGGISILPGFTSVAVYNTNIKNATSSASSEIKTFFAPIHGTNNDEYYNANFKDIPDIIDDEFKKGMVYKQVRNAYWRMFFDNNYPTGNAKGLSSVPYTLRSYINVSSEKIAYSRSNVVAQAFYEHYFPLTQDASVRDSGDDLIDSYIAYNVSADSRDVGESFTHDYTISGVRTENRFDLKGGSTVTLDLANFFGNDANMTALQVQNFEQTLHPILKRNCTQCHGDGGGQIKHASSNAYVAYDSIISRIDFGVPGDSIPVRQMVRNHNCGGTTSCDAIEAEMKAAISTWADKNAVSAQTAISDLYKSYSDKEKTPGRAKYKINITESGRYNVWLKMMTGGSTRDSIIVRVLDKDSRIVSSSKKATNGQTSASTTRRYSTGSEFGDWTWYTPEGDISAIRNATRFSGVPGDKVEEEKIKRINAQYERRIFWDLNPGEYTIELIETEIGTAVDLIAISSNREFHPLDNLKDEGFIQDIEPKILKFDISSLIGSRGFFEIEIKEENEGSFIFRAPKITGNSNNVKVRNIKALVNKQYEFNNSTYTKIDAVSGTTGRILTYAPLLTLKVDKKDCTIIQKNRGNYSSELEYIQVYNECLGTLSDSFQFGFAELHSTNASETSIQDDYLGEIENVVCKDLDKFVKTVKPILRSVRLFRKGTASDDNDGYSQHEFPGDRRNEVDNPTFYQCMGCHNEEHPYFKMTTFGDDKVLCAQALSRVNYLEPEASTILRGLNGYGAHPKLHFAEDVKMNGDKSDYLKNTDGSLKSTWVGMRYEKYSSADINLSAPGLNTLDKEFLQKMVGKYKSIRYQRADDPEGDEFGIIVTDRDTVDVNGNLVFTGDTLVERNIDRGIRENGKNIWTVVTPNSLLPATQDKMTDVNAPIYGGSRVIMMDRCKDKPIRNDLDECNSNINFNTEFEVLKEKYRSVIRIWIQSEINKGAFDDI